MNGIACLQDVLNLCVKLHPAGGCKAGAGGKDQDGILPRLGRDTWSQFEGVQDLFPPLSLRSVLCVCAGA